MRLDPYSNARIRSGARSFMLGKALTSIAGVLSMVLVVRALPIAEFAGYSVMFGIVEVLLVVSSVGTIHVLNRYVPEIYALHYGGALRRLMTVALGVRFGVLIAVLGVCASYIDPIATSIGLGDWREVLLLYLVVALFRTVNNTCYQVLESMLSQKQGQSAFALVTLTRFGLIALFYLKETLDLEALVLIEIASELAGAIAMTKFVILQAGAKLVPSTDSEAERGWLTTNRRRMFDFGLKGYLQGMLILPYSGMVNRLIVGGYFPSAQIAQFGFAQTVFDLLVRYLPAQFFAGIVRPVMAARYSSGGGFGQVQTLTNLTLRINLILIGLAISCLYAGGDDMLLAITRGKYGATSMQLLVLMLGLLALESWRHVLDQMSHTLERYGFLVFSNALLGTSLLVGIALFDVIGIYALPAANAGMVVIANLMVIAWVRHSGHPYRPDFVSPLIIAAVCIVIAIAAVGIPTPGLHWGVRVAIAGVAYIAAIWFVLVARSTDRQTLASLLAKRRTVGESTPGRT